MGKRGPPAKICEVPGCGGKHVGLGFCRKHYFRFQRWGDPNGFAPPSFRPTTCSVLDCGRKVKARGYCQRHYLQWLKYGFVPPRHMGTKHGHGRNPLYHVWFNMMQRCYKPDHPAYHNYGGRGIRVCERWHDLQNFIDDVAPRPDGGLSIDRRDNDGDYGPDNFRWADWSTQAANRRPRRRDAFGRFTD